jgi:uncharacterized protein involved in outer membrane biogenesis
MKKKYKIIFWIGGIFLVIFFIANLLISAFAPGIVQQQLEQSLKLKCHLDKISLSLPFTIVLEKLEIGDLASIKKISFSPNLVALLFGKIVIAGLNIIEPVINLEQSAEGKLNLPVLEEKGKSPAIYVTSLNLRDGKIFFMDKKVVPEGFGVIVNKLNIKVTKVALPITSLATNFSVNAELLTHQGEVSGKITFAGWLDYLAKDMDAQLEVKDLDVTKFSVYYGNFISNRKLSSARLDLSSNFKAKNNALKIITKFNLSHLVYAPVQGQEQQLDLNLMKNALDIFTDPQGNLSLEFYIDTQLDNPSLNQEKVQKIILKAAAKNLGDQAPQQLLDKVISIIDQYKGAGKELKAIFGQ